MVFWRIVSDPLKILKEKWLNDESNTNLLDHVSEFKYKLNRASENAREKFNRCPKQNEKWYDEDTKNRTIFSPGDQVLVLFPIPGHPLQARYHGPYTVESKVGEVDYIVKTPDRRKRRQLSHINMLKEYVDRNDDGSVKPVCSVGPSQEVSHDDNPEMEVDQHDNGDDKLHEYPMNLQNFDVLANLDGKLGHLSLNVRVN